MLRFVTTTLLSLISTVSLLFFSCHFVFLSSFLHIPTLLPVFKTPKRGTERWRGAVACSMLFQQKYEEMAGRETEGLDGERSKIKRNSNRKKRETNSYFSARAPCFPCFALTVSGDTMARETRHAASSSSSGAKQAR